MRWAPYKLPNIGARRSPPHFGAAPRRSGIRAPHRRRASSSAAILLTSSGIGSALKVNLCSLTKTNDTFRETDDLRQELLCHKERSWQDYTPQSPTDKLLSGSNGLGWHGVPQTLYPASQNTIIYTHKQIS